MTEALAAPSLEINRARPPTALDSPSARTVEIVAPNRDCADLLLEYTPPTFRAEIISGPAWIVRLEPQAGGRWVPELLALVERWLVSVPLPCTKVLYGGRSYLIHATTNIAQFAATVGSTSVSASEPSR
jgi:hypothetical protein